MLRIIFSAFIYFILHFQDLALVSLANIYHQSGYFHSALITAGAALRNSPRFVVVHFTLANIYASIVSR